MMCMATIILCFVVWCVCVVLEMCARHSTHFTGVGVRHRSFVIVRCAALGPYIVPLTFCNFCNFYFVATKYISFQAIECVTNVIASFHHVFTLFQCLFNNFSLMPLQALSCISPAPVDGRHCYKGRASSHRVRSPLSQQQLRCISIKASDSSWREQLQLEVREEMLNYAHHFYAHSMPPAFFESYLTVLSSMCGSNWGLTLAMAVLSIQPIILPLIVYARMHSFSMERALKPYTGAVSKYIHELTSVHDYAVAWRAYRSRRVSFARG